MKVSVIGTGYVGLVSGVCLAEKGHDVVCVDNDQSKVELINQGKSPIYEPGLNKLLIANIGKRLLATTNMRDAVLNSYISIIAVGTPFDGNEIDLRYIRQVAEEIGIILRDKNEFHVIIVKSTVIPGTTENNVTKIIEYNSKKTAGLDFGVCMNPEFLREGTAVEDFLNPDRIILGTSDKKSLGILEELYSVFSNVDVIKTNIKTAETIKYTCNAFLAMLISFSNEIGNLCATFGDVDSIDVLNGIYLDKRISPILPNGERIIPGITTYLYPGCGFGGSCFPKDVSALIAQGRKLNQTMSILESVMTTNKKQPYQVIGRLKKHFRDLKGRNVAVLGLAFKPGTDDLRESPAIPIIRKLAFELMNVIAYDPIAVDQAKIEFKDLNITYSKTLEEAVINVDAILVLTNWAVFRELPLILKRAEVSPLVVDGRRMYSKDEFSNYEGIGS